MNRPETSPAGNIPSAPPTSIVFGNGTPDAGVATMEIVDDGHCFACGPRNESGLKLCFSLTAETMRASATTRIAAQFCGWRQAVHGGIITALLDEAMVYACGAAGLYVATASLNVRFRKPVPIETPLQVEGQVTRKTNRFLQAQSRILRDNQVLAEAHGTFAVMRPIVPGDPMFQKRSAGAEDTE